MLKINTDYFHPQVFSRLWYPIVRQGALTVLSHMLLSFQHSPEAFHLVRDLLSLISLSLSDAVTLLATFPSPPGSHCFRDAQVSLDNTQTSIQLTLK